MKVTNNRTVAKSLDISVRDRLHTIIKAKRVEGVQENVIQIAN
jgi:hypothetical protein